MSTTTMDSPISSAEEHPTLHDHRDRDHDHDHDDHDRLSNEPGVIVKDVVTWRRKTLSTVVLLVSTALWVAMKIYEFSFVTLASWMAIALVSLLFIVGNIHRLMNKGEPDMTMLQIDERYVLETAKTLKQLVEQGIMWMFQLGAKADFLAFATLVASLWLMSWISGRVDSLTLVYLGVISGLTVPVVYVMYENKVKEYGCRLKMQGHKYYEMIEEMVGKLKNRVAATKKDKKIE